MGEAACYARLDLNTPGLVCSPGLQIIFDGVLLGSVHLLLVLPAAFLIVRRVRTGATSRTRIHTAAGLLLLTSLIAAAVPSVLHPGSWGEAITLLLPVAIQCATALLVASVFPIGPAGNVRALP